MKVDELLKENEGSLINVYYPGGCRGDGLVYAGFHELLEKNDIGINTDWERDECMWMLSCGGWNKSHHRAPWMLRQLLMYYKKLIVLPSL